MIFSANFKEFLSSFKGFKDESKIAGLEAGKIKLSVDWCALILREAASRNRPLVMMELFIYAESIGIKKTDLINKECKMGQSALTKAVLKGHKGAAAFLIGHNADFSPNLKLDAEWCGIFLRAASRAGLIGTTKKIFEYARIKAIKTEDFINLKEEGEQNTALIEAVLKDDADIFDLLIANGASLYRYNAKKETPLSLAHDGKKGKILKTFLGGPHKLTYYDEFGNNIVENALQNNQIGFAKWLVEQGCIDINESIQAPKGSYWHFNKVPLANESLTPLLRVIKAGKVQENPKAPASSEQILATRLIAIGANNIISQSGEYPLIAAITKGWVSLATMLLNGVEDANCRDRQGHTPLKEVFLCTRACTSLGSTINSDGLVISNDVELPQSESLLRLLFIRGVKPLNSDANTESDLFFVMRIFRESEKLAHTRRDYESKVQVYTLYKMLSIVIDHCKSINEMDKKAGITALTLASQLASPLLVELLLHKGAVPIMKKKEKVSNSITVGVKSSQQELNDFFKRRDARIELEGDSKEESEKMRLAQSKFIPQLRTVQLIYTFPGLGLPTPLRKLVVDYFLPIVEVDKVKPKMEIGIRRRRFE